MARLTAAQRRHLSELKEIAARNHGEAYWYPNSAGEWRCAEALSRRGLLERHFRPHAFAVTAAGLEAVADA